MATRRWWRSDEVRTTADAEDSRLFDALARRGPAEMLSAADRERVGLAAALLREAVAVLRSRPDPLDAVAPLGPDRPGTWVPAGSESRRAPERTSP